MSSAGTIFREYTVAKVDITGDGAQAGSGSYEFLIENDGFLLSIERLDGTGSITGSIYTDLPDPMSELKLTDIATVSTSNEPARYAYVANNCNRVALSWDGPVTFRVHVKSVSGDAVGEFSESTAEKDTVKDPIIENISIPTKNIEQSHQLPASTRRFKLWSRSRASLKISFIAGDTGTDFITVISGNKYKEVGLDPTQTYTVYFQSTKDNDVLEVLTWRP